MMKEAIKRLQTEHKKGKDICVKLDSVSELLQIAEASEGIPKLGIKISSSCKFGAEEFQEYIKAFRNGTAEKAEKVKAFGHKIKKSSDLVRENQFLRVEDGGAVDVARYLRGRRDCYIRRQKAEVQKSTAILVQLSLSWQWEKSEIENRLAGVMGLVDKMKAERRPVRVVLSYMPKHSSGKGSNGKFVQFLFDVTNSDTAQLLQFATEKFYRLICLSTSEVVFGGKYEDKSDYFNTRPHELSDSERSKVKKLLGVEKLVILESGLGGVSEEREKFQTLEKAVKTVAEMYNEQG